MESNSSKIQTEITTDTSDELENYSDQAYSRKDQKSTAGPLKLILLGLGLGILILLLIAGMFFGLNMWNKLRSSSSEEASETASAIMIKCYDEDTSMGDLYYRLPESESIKIDSYVHTDEFKVLPNTQTVYYLKGDEMTLCSYTPEGGTEEIASSVVFSSLAFSKDEKTIAFRVERNEGDGRTYDLYIKPVASEKEKITSDCGYGDVVLSDDGTKVYYIDSENKFYEWTSETESVKIASNVSYFSACNNAYSYTTHRNETPDSYIKLEEQVDPQKLEDYADKVTFIAGGYAAIYTADMVYNEAGSYGELYLYIENIGEIKVASDVTATAVTDEITNPLYLYYDNYDGELYAKVLPEINEKTRNNPRRFLKAFDESLKVKLGDDVQDYRTSDDGTRVLFLDTDSDLYICTNLENKVRIKSDVTDFYSCNHRFVLLTDDGNLYVNNKGFDAENVKENTNLVEENTEAIACTEKSRHIAYRTEGGRLRVLSDGTNIQTLIDDVTEYDKIFFANVNVYEKILSMQDFAGMYYLEDTGELFRIKDDGTITSYEAGEPSKSTMEIRYPIDKFSSAVLFRIPAKDSDERTVPADFAVDSDNKKKISVYNKDYYPESLTEDEFKEKIQEQIEQEEKRFAEERRKKELEARVEKQEARGMSYMRNGYFVSSSDSLYDSHDYNSEVVGSFTKAGTKGVTDFYVSDDGYTLWLKLSASQSGTSRYVWIPAE